MDDVADAPRFGALRSSPPAAVLDALGGLGDASTEPTWTATPLGNAGGYPNGGIWRVAGVGRAARPSASVVKRTGPRHLGTSPVWRNRVDPRDAQWWGREAEFYLSDLATAGWTDRARAARGHVDDHHDVRDLWLEEVEHIPADLGTCVAAVTGLAHWQASHVHADQPWLAQDWIATHVGRHALDNDRTLAHPAWPAAIDRGLDPALRDRVRHRTTDPARVAAALDGFPQSLTHHDFHAHNLGTVGDVAVIIDWAYVGWGPVGHDAGHLVLSLPDDDTTDVTEVWDAVADAYCAGLAAAGSDVDPVTVRTSMAVSNQLRLGWFVDHVLDHAADLSDQELTRIGTKLQHLADLGDRGR